MPGESINETRELVYEFNDDNYRRVPLPETAMVLFHNLSRQSQNRRVYRFSGDLFHELSQMADEMQEDDKITAEFLRLPFDAISIQIDDTEAFYKLKEQGIGPLDEIFGQNTSIIVTSVPAGEVHDLYPCLIGSMWSPIGSICTLVLPLQFMT